MSIFAKSAGLFLAGVIGGVMILQSVSFFIITRTEIWSCNEAGPLSFPGGGIWYALLGLALLAFFIKGTFSEIDFRSNRTFTCGLLAICIGGFSNALERFFSACVVDYLHFPHLFAFNGADVLLTLGGIGVIVAIVKQYREKRHVR